MEKSIPKTLLVVKNRAMGDSVMTLATLQYLKDRLPNTRIIYGVPKWISPLYENVETAADQIISLDFSKLTKWFEMRRLIKSLEVDTVLELFQSGRTAKFFKLWKTFGGPRYVYHNHHTKEGQVHDQGVIKSNIQRDLDAAWTFFGRGTLPPSYLGYCPEMKVSKNKPNKSHTVILGVVATRQTKMWPLEFYGELTHLLEKKGKKVIIPLGPNDNEIEEKLRPIVSSQTLFTKDSLKGLPTRLATCEQYIGNDTGLKHICISLGISTFTLFGPEPPTEWHPYNQKTHPYYFREPLSCRTENAHYCGLNTCESMICLNQITANQLFQLIYN